VDTSFGFWIGGLDWVRRKKDWIEIGNESDGGIDGLKPLYHVPGVKVALVDEGMYL